MEIPTKAGDAEVSHIHNGRADDMNSENNNNNADMSKEEMKEPFVQEQSQEVSVHNVDENETKQTQDEEKVEEGLEQIGDGDLQKEEQGGLPSHEDIASGSIKEENENDEVEDQKQVQRRSRDGSLTSSMGLRRLPIDILLQPSSDFELSDVEKDVELDEDIDPTQDGDANSGPPQANNNGGPKTCKGTIGFWWWWVHDLFLSPEYKLNSQLMLSFGSVNFWTIVWVIATCIFASYYVGRSVKQINQEAFENRLVRGIQATTVRYLAETLEQQFMPIDLIDMIEEATQDRFQGYPNSLFEGNSSVPFKDIVTGRNIYPIVGDPMPLDWQVTPDVTEDNYLEHVIQPDRWERFLKKQPAVSTKSAVFYYQGPCDPTVTNTDNKDDAWFYLENCTAANNNITAGGAIHAVETLAPIYRGSSDILPLFKAIYETTPEIRNLGLFFASMGAGASFHFPAYPLNSNTNYTSVGCDWMSTLNPVDQSLGPIGTQTEISRCHAEGESVSSRLYNPLERSWCRDQALNPNKTQLNTFIDAFDDQHWLLSVGRAIYDRQTKHFVSCIFLGISLSFVEEKLRESLVTDNSVLSLVRFDPNGTVVTSTASPTSGTTSTAKISTIDQLRVGLTQASYQHMYDIIQKSLELGDNETWNPEEVRAIHRNITERDADFLISVSLMPRVPEDYDPDYKPEFLVVMSTSTSDVFEGVRKLDDAVDEDVENIIVFSLIAGVVGLGFATFVIVLMSKTLTAPLSYINDSTDAIVGSFGQTRISEDGADEDDDCGDEDEDEDGDDKALKKMEEADIKTGENVVTPSAKEAFAGTICSPKTELNDVLEEFNVMVSNFSGSIMSKSEKARRVEVRNKFNLRDEFEELYRSRKDPDFPYNHENILKTEGDGSTYTGGSNRSDNSRSKVGFIHIGSNIDSSQRNLISNDKKASGGATRKQFGSQLFLWTVALIATPLLLTTILISAVVVSTIRSGFEQSVQGSKEYYIGVKLDALTVHVRLRAELVGRLTSVPARDAYFLTRYFGWLLFGGVNRADSYSEVLNGVGPCSAYAANNISECPYIQENAVCDCAWNDHRGQCQDFPNGSRHLQRPGISVESSGALQDGDRFKTTFPKTSFSPETTEWWSNVETVPGSYKNSSAAGHDFLYDRLRVSSAMPLFPVLYNYDRHKVNFLGQHIAFEADGMFFGYVGCRHSGVTNVGSSTWESTEWNGAAKLRPDLCPVGKFGYDPRCRGWYNTGRNLAVEENISMHISEPYPFSDDGLVGQSVTLPLIDPSSGEHVGQILHDFFSNTIFGALENKTTPLTKGGFPILIAVQGNPKENTVLADQYGIGNATAEISRVVLQRDHDCETTACEMRVQNFSDIVLSMKAGGKNTTNFTRESQNGGTELIHISYAPVKVRSSRPVDSSDFARGVEVSEYVIYSLGLCETDNALLQPFKEIEEEVVSGIRWAIGAIAAAIFVAALFVIYISYRVTISITEPMINLLEVIRCINKADFDGDPPNFDHSKGSSEITKVSDTILVLYQIVRATNDFFFAGELEIAYSVLVDALGVFKQLGNKKAIAVASNNLGCIMLSIYIEMKALGLRKRCGLTRKEIIARGTGHFHEAITLGEKSYDEFYEAEGWTPNCLDFMQHLSNRYFNRALFLLTVKDDHIQPEEIVKLGTRDLEIARDMFFETIEYGADVGFNRENRAHKQFQAQLIRSRGNNMLLEMGYPDQVMTEKGYPDDWELGERLDENFKLLRIENERESSELFNEVNVLGRLQDIECAIMKYRMLTGDLDMAAKIAIRMLYEDAFVFAEALATAVDILIDYADKLDLDNAARARVKDELISYTKSIDQELETVDGDTKVSTRVSTRVASLAFSLDNSSVSERLSTRMSTPIDGGSSSLAGWPLSNKTKSNWVKKQFSGGLVTMEDF